MVVGAGALEALVVTFWSGRTVVVTGATGFLGSHLTARLLEVGAQVRVLVRDDLPSSPLSDGWRDDVTVVRGDVTDQDAVAALVDGAATVVHLAAQSQVAHANHDPSTTFEVNVRGTWSVLEAVRRAGSVAHVVVASSDKAYGSQPSLPYTEDMPLLAQHPYDASKACAEVLARTYHASYGMPVSVTRCANLYGPGDTNWDRVIPGTLRSLISGQRPVVRSDGTPTRDYLHVSDAVGAVLCLAETMADGEGAVGQAFNVSAEEPMSVLEVIAALQAAAGTDLEPDIRGDSSNEIDHQYLSAEKARRVLGWKAQRTFEEGLATTVDWYRAHLAG